MSEQDKKSEAGREALRAQVREFEKEDELEEKIDKATKKAVEELMGQKEAVIAKGPQIAGQEAPQQAPVLPQQPQGIEFPSS